MFSGKDGLISFHQHSLQIHSRTKRQIKDLLNLNNTTQHNAQPHQRRECVVQSAMFPSVTWLSNMTRLTATLWGYHMSCHVMHEANAGTWLNDQMPLNQLMDLIMVLYEPRAAPPAAPEPWLTKTLPVFWNIMNPIWLNAVSYALYRLRACFSELNIVT